MTQYYLSLLQKKLDRDLQEIKSKTSSKIIVMKN